MATDISPEQIKQLSDLLSPFAKQLEDANKKIDLLLAENKRLREEKESLEKGMDIKKAEKISEFKKRDFIKGFLIKKGMNKPVTIQNIISRLKSFKNFINKNYLDVTLEDVSKYYNYELNINKTKKSSLNQKHMTLKEFYKYIIDEQNKENIKIIKDNPFQEIQYKMTKEPPKPGMNKKQAIKFIETGYKIKGQRIYSIIAEILIGTGLRIDELLSLKKKDIDLKERIIYVRDSKTGIPRQTSYPRILKQILYVHFSKKQPEDFLLNISYKRVLRHFNTIGEMAEIEVIDQRGEKRKTAPHMTRHTFATTLYAKGVPIGLLNRIMGHAVSSSTTEAVYIDKTWDEIMAQFRPLNDKYTILNEVKRF